MILAGVDEAGYGPLLGPLVVGCCAFRVNDVSPDQIPCLWSRLRGTVRRNRSKTGGKLHINDSKAVYTPSIGIKELERSVLALATQVHGWSETLPELLTRIAPDAAGDVDGYPWYIARAGEQFPLAQQGISVRLVANALAAEIAQKQTPCVYLAARLLCERQWNGMLNATRNKANALFSVAAIHLDKLLRTFGRQNLTIVCDQQGGRRHYGHLLRVMFNEWSLEVVDESDHRSEYRLIQDGHATRLIFMEKAEGQSLPTAAASMISKYLREAMMRRFNAFWLSHLPSLEPTAGYYTDGLRFLRDIQQKRTELGIADGELIRCR
jgi:hypothetical protein